MTTDNLDFRHHSYKDMRQVGCLSRGSGLTGELVSSAPIPDMACLRLMLPGHQLVAPPSDARTGEGLGLPAGATPITDAFPLS